MNIRLFTLCDGAYNYNGKLTIVGTTDNIKVQKFPAIVSIGFAFKASFAPQESGKKIVSLRFVNSRGETIMPPQAYPPVEPHTTKGEESRLAIGGILQGLRFEEEGNYSIIVSINQDEFKLPFIVHK